MSIYVGTNVFKRILIWPVELWAVIEVRQIDLEHFSACPEDFKPIPLTLPNLRNLLCAVSSSNEFCAFNDSLYRFRYDEGVLQLYKGPDLLPQGLVSPQPIMLHSIDSLQVFLRKNSLLCPKIQGARWKNLGYKSVIKDD